MASRVPFGGSEFAGEEGRVQEELLGVGVFLTPIEAAGGGQGAVEVGEGLGQAYPTAEAGEQVHGVGADHLGGLDQTALGTGPAAGEGEPVLDEDGEQLGPDFTEDPPGLGAAGLVDAAVLLPQPFRAKYLPPLRR